jgi:3-hydroxyisobutyrate dehydrogenase-like beta-hydroxyacid dehydrogenase
MMRIALIGVGAMGEPMASNLLKKGFEVTLVQHRRAEACSRLKALGARVAASPAEAVGGCALAVLSLPTSTEVEEVVGGPRGLIDAAAPGTVIVDCSTSEPASTRRLHARLAERGIGFIDAPVTRGVQGARQGTLAFFLGGSDAHIEHAMPALQAMGDTFIRCGAIGQAHTVKIVSNVLSYGTVALVNEALMLGVRLGVDSATLHEALMQGAPSKALEAFGPRLLKAEYEPARVSVDHACDDMVLAQKLAVCARGPVFMLAAAQELYRLLRAQGHGEADIAALAELWRTSERSV